MNNNLINIKKILLSNNINPLSIDTSNDVLEEKTAYHGSPYNFEKFSIQHIGNGEGEQMFGWGLYFAESPEVVNYYISNLSKYYNNNIELTKEEKQSMSSFIEIDNINGTFKKKPFDEVMNRMSETFKKVKYSQEKIDNIIKKYKELYDGLNVKGYFYEIDIPDSNVLLDWNKNINKQPKKVMEALTKAYNETKDIKSLDYNKDEFEFDPYDVLMNPDKYKTTTTKELVNTGSQKVIREYLDPKNSWYTNKLTGGDLYRSLAENFGGWYSNGSRHSASEYLYSFGIPGLQYLDSGSRDSKGKITHNYVIWDDKAVRILNRITKGN
jgi:translation initiation factor 2 beta subunit (eIF-2beta)/eIF-5